MSQPQLPPIYRDCRRLLLHTEVCVQRFSRYHKYTVGTDLRQQAMIIMRGVHVAVYDKANQLRHIQALVWEMDAYKLTLQLAIDIGAFVHGKAGQQKTTAPGLPSVCSALVIPVVSFVVKHPKTREIHAPDFADRVVHHIFVHDSYANRAGRGSHSAVDRLQAFMRQRENMPDTTVVGGWYLQLDIHNFFNSIHRPTLYAMLCQRLVQAQRRGKLPASHALALRSLCHKLLAQRVAERVRSLAAAAGVPPHKRLCNAAPSCGLPVGNLTSQFFANVYLNALDQFVKHTLKVRHYVRYVDDFVLLGDSPAQLKHWQAQIEAFLPIIAGYAYGWCSTAAPSSNIGINNIEILSVFVRQMCSNSKHCWAAIGGIFLMPTVCVCVSKYSVKCFG